MMPVADTVVSLPETIKKDSRQQFRNVCRAVVLVLAVFQLWALRFFIDADGTAYVDCARSWLAGNWTHALNAYWSPLYIWLITIALAIFHPSIHWELPLLHLIALLGFLSACAAWEWLISEWEQWQGPPANPLLTDLTGYCVLVWAGLRLTGLGWFHNADVIVMALLLGVCAVIIRVRRGVAVTRDFVVLGALLGTGFLAKTAFSAVIPIFFIVLALLLHSWLDKRIVIAAATTCAIIAPFIAALSIVHGRLTMGDSGRLNYSWQVTGISVEGYKENAYWPPPEIHHPIHVLLKNPRVISFEQHLVGTLPVHSDVSWWCEGYPVRFDKARQLMILWSNIRFSIFTFRCPAVLLFLICMPFGASLMMKRFARLWFLWVPVLFLAFTYCFVFSESRYLAGSYAVIGFALIAAAWRIRLSNRISQTSLWAVPILTVVFLMGGGFRHVIGQFFGDITGLSEPWGYTNVELAEHMHALGLQPGDRVAYIGFSLAAAHVGLEQAHIVAMIPERITHDDPTWGRPLVFKFPRPHNFWWRSPADQERVLEAFRSVGAKWVFADTVPIGANTEGWHRAATFDADTYGFRVGDLPYVYVRKL